MSTSNAVLDGIAEQKLAVLGGPKAVPGEEPDLFRWPIVTEEDEQAVLGVLRDGTMSAWSITAQFEEEFAKFIGTKHGLCHPNGTMSLLTAMYAVGLRPGDEMICPSITYWASAMPAFSLGATLVFADIDPKTLCIDPADIERHIGPRTKAIMVVHYCGHPADMDAIMAIAAKHNLIVIEDVSHAHGTMYKGKMTGTFGKVAAMSLMSGKSFPIGEGGILVTDDQEVYERAVAFSHYARHKIVLTVPELKRLAGIPLGGVKGRLNQTASAMGRVQLKHYPARAAEIQKSINYFWDLLEGTPGLRAHRPEKGSGSTMGGWYNPVGLYEPGELGGLSVEKFVEAVVAEGGRCGRAVNAPLHIHPVMTEADIYGHGKPTRLALATRDVSPESRVAARLARNQREVLRYTPTSSTTGRSLSRSTPRPSARWLCRRTSSSTDQPAGAGRWRGAGPRAQAHGTAELREEASNA